MKSYIQRALRPAQVIFLIFPFLFAIQIADCAPRPPQPPWPEPALRIYGFDSAYARVPWKDVALHEADSVVESWSGYALVRDAFATAPVVIPLELDSARPNFKLDSGAIRFWLAPQWSTAATKMDGGPGHVAHLLQLVTVQEQKAQGKWTLCVNETGDTLYLVADTLAGPTVLLKAPVEFVAEDWRLITLGYSPTNTALWLDNQLIGEGAGLPELAWFEKSGLGLVVGSDLFVGADNVANAQFEELTLLPRWPRQSDWHDLYFVSGKRRSWLGPLGTKEEEAAKVAELKAAGWLPEDYGVASRSGEEDGPMVAYSYAPGTLWLEITGVSNQLAYLIVHGTVEGETYEILSKESLDDLGWAGEVPLVEGALGQDWTPTTVPIGTRTNGLFFWARAWLDSDGWGLPDWWQDQYFSQLGIDPYADSDGDGWTNIEEYQNGTNPNQFNTPPAPKGFGVTTAASGTNALLRWLPGNGPVVGYTIERDSGGFQISVGGTTVSFTDTQTNLPSGWYYDHHIPSYRVRVDYAGGSSGWTDWQQVSELLSPVAQFVSGASGAHVVLQHIPAAATAVRVGNFAWNGSMDAFVTSVDIPVAQFFNGSAALPASFLATSTNSQRTLRFVLTNDVTSAVPWAYWELADIRPFWDARAQLKDNLRFLLRVPTPYLGLRYGVYTPGWNGVWWWSYVLHPDFYAHASYTDIWEGYDWITGAPYVSQWVAPRQPYEDNHFYQQFIYAPANVDVYGRMNTGLVWSPGALDLYGPISTSLCRPVPAPHCPRCWTPTPPGG